MGRTLDLDDPRQLPLFRDTFADLLFDVAVHDRPRGPLPPLPVKSQPVKFLAQSTTIDRRSRIDQYAWDRPGDQEPA